MKDHSRKGESVSSSSTALGGADERGAKWGGTCGLIAGILFVASYATLFFLPTGPADQVLAKYNSFSTVALLGQAAIALLALFAIPFAIGLRASPKSRGDLFPRTG
jgi:hypothetical protein